MALLDSLVNGIFGAATSSSNLSKQYEYNSKLMAESNDYAVANAATAQGYNKELMDIQNQYDVQNATTAYEREVELAKLEDNLNSYQNQRADLIKAGYNPNALFSAGSSGVSVGSAPMSSSQAVTGGPNAGSPGSSVSLPTNDTPFNDILNGISGVVDLFKSKSQIKNDKSQRELNALQAYKTSVESDYQVALTEKTNMETAFQQKMNELQDKYGDEEAASKLEELKGNLKLLQDRISQSDIETKNIQQYGPFVAYIKAMKEVEELSSSKLSNEYQSIVNEYAPKQLAANINLCYSNAALNASQISLNTVKEQTEVAQQGMFIERAKLFQSQAESSDVATNLQVQDYAAKKSMFEFLTSSENIHEISSFYNISEELAKGVMYDVVYNNGHLSDRWNGYTDPRKWNGEDDPTGSTAFIRDVNMILGGTVGSVFSGMFK